LLSLCYVTIFTVEEDIERERERERDLKVLACRTLFCLCRGVISNCNRYGYSVDNSVEENSCIFPLM